MRVQRSSDKKLEARGAGRRLRSRNEKDSPRFSISPQAEQIQQPRSSQRRREPAFGRELREGTERLRQEAGGKRCKAAFAIAQWERSPRFSISPQAEHQQPRPSGSVEAVCLSRRFMIVPILTAARKRTPPLPPRAKSSSCEHTL